MSKLKYIISIYCMLLLSHFPNSKIYASDITSYNVNIKKINSIPLAAMPIDIQLLDGKVYILTMDPLYSIDVSDPLNAKDVVKYSAVSGAEAMAFSNRYGYFAMGNQVKIYDFSSNPPAEKNYFMTAGTIAKMSVLGGYLCFIRKDLGLYVYDIKNPDSPVLKGSQIVPGEANGLFLFDNKAYVTCSSAHLSIIDFTDPVKLPVVGTYTFGVNFYDVYVKDNFVYLPQGSAGVQVLNVKKPANPEWVANIFSRKFSKQLVMSNYYAWVNDDNTIQAFYNKDTKSYLYAGEYKNEGYAINRISVDDGKFIYLLSSDNQFKILQIEYNY